MKAKWMAGWRFGTFGLVFHFIHGMSSFSTDELHQGLLHHPPTRCKNASHSKPFLALQWPMVQLPQLTRAGFLGTWDEMAKSSKKSLNPK